MLIGNANKIRLNQPVSIPELGMDQQQCKLVQPLQYQTEYFLRVFQGI